MHCHQEHHYDVAVVCNQYITLNWHQLHHTLLDYVLVIHVPAMMTQLVANLPHQVKAKSQISTSISNLNAIYVDMSLRASHSCVPNTPCLLHHTVQHSGSKETGSMLLEAQEARPCHKSKQMARPGIALSYHKKHPFSLWRQQGHMHCSAISPYQITTVTSWLLMTDCAALDCNSVIVPLLYLLQQAMSMTLTAR